MKDFIEILETLGWDRAIYSLATDDPDIALLCEIYKMAYRTSDYQCTVDPDGGLCWKIRNFCIEQIIDLLERKEKDEMSKYCELAGKVTNCTDNCRECLEEENTREIEVGDKIRYIADDTEDLKRTGYFPPKGTIGMVVKIDSDDVAPYHIQWPEGTTRWSSCRYVSRNDIELVD